MILFVAAEMFRQIKDTARKERDLHFRRTRIIFIRTEFGNDSLFSSALNIIIPPIKTEPSQSTACSSE